MANYLLDYRRFKAIFEAANEEVEAMIAAAKSSDEGTEVPSKPAYEPLFTWFSNNAIKGSADSNVDALSVKKSIEYWTGDSSRKGNTKFDKVLQVLEYFSDSEKAKLWLAELATATGRQGTMDADLPALSKNAKILHDKIKEVEAQGWIIKNGINVSYASKPIEGKKSLGYIPRNFSPDFLTILKARQWDENKSESAYNNFIAWQKNLNSNIDSVLTDLNKPQDETVFYRGAVAMESKDKLLLLDALQAKADKYASSKDAKYDSASEAIENAYSIRISPKGGVSKEEKSEVVKEPGTSTVTMTASKSISDPAEAMAMFENNVATFKPGYANAQIQKIVTAIDEIKKTEGFSKLTSVSFRAISSTNVIPTTFEYSGKSGNEALADARVDALVTAVINPAIEKAAIKDISTLTKKPVPGNFDETAFPGSSKWTSGGNVNDKKYVEFRYSTVEITVTYEITKTSTTPGETIEDVDYAGEWKITIKFTKPTGGDGGNVSQTKLPRGWKPKQSSETVKGCNAMCGAYD